MCIVYNNDIFFIVEFQYVKLGKGVVFVCIKLKSLIFGKVLDYIIFVGYKIQDVRVECCKF